MAGIVKNLVIETQISLAFTAVIYASLDGADLDDGLESSANVSRGDSINIERVLGRPGDGPLDRIRASVHFELPSFFRDDGDTVTTRDRYTRAHFPILFGRGGAKANERDRRRGRSRDGKHAGVDGWSASNSVFIPRSDAPWLS